jgi:hypothetical protein
VPGHELSGVVSELGYGTAGLTVDQRVFGLAGGPRRAGAVGRLQPIIGAVRPLAEVPSAFAPDRRMPGKTIIRVTEGE